MHIAGSGLETPRYYQEKARQCLRLMRNCLDNTAIETLTRLAQEYGAMAEALKQKESTETTPQPVAVEEQDGPDL
jgi:hypothetical protein